MAEYPSSIINLGSILAIQAEVEAVKATIEGMKATNSQRVMDDNQLAYTQEHFDEQSEDLVALADQLRKL